MSGVVVVPIDLGQLHPGPDVGGGDLDPGLVGVQLGAEDGDAIIRKRLEKQQLLRENLGYFFTRSHHFCALW